GETLLTQTRHTSLNVGVADELSFSDASRSTGLGEPGAASGVSVSRFSERRELLPVRPEPRYK
ncbi:MAG: hypothetical protein AAF640_13635, partial [Pseudomonadota bacterium]